jgi:hypothetical protein
VAPTTPAPATPDDSFAALAVPIGIGLGIAAGLALFAGGGWCVVKSLRARRKRSNRLLEGNDASEAVYEQIW